MRLYLSLGSNLGDREATINKALELLSERIGGLLKRSSFYYSPAWGFESQHEFCNLCALFDTDLDPFQVLAVTQQIEQQLGRRRPDPSGQRYHDRPIDIDIIKMGDIRLTSPTLTIPHPLYLQRAFVTIPLSELE